MDLGALEPGDLADARRLFVDGGLADAAAVAEEKLFGASPDDAGPATYAAREGGRLIGVAARSARWLRLLAVHPPHPSPNGGAQQRPDLATVPRLR